MLKITPLETAFLCHFIIQSFCFPWTFCPNVHSRLANEHAYLDTFWTIFSYRRRCLQFHVQMLEV